MTNSTKWLLALPFTVLVAFLLPGLIAGRLLWFLEDWGDFTYILFTAGMWLLATAFVDVSSQRIEPDLPRRLLTIGLIFNVPLTVADRVYGPAATFSGVWRTAGLVVCVLAAMLGIAARISLGRYYAPHPATSSTHRLVTTGPFRWIRHPLYTAACLWVIGWPLLARSVAGAMVMTAFVVPFLALRIRQEERELLKAFGDEYARYQDRTWKLFPFLY